MVPSIATLFLRALISGAILAVLFGVIATWVWMLPRLFRGRSFLPEQPIVERRRPPWGVGTILLVAALYYVLGGLAFLTYGLAAHPERAKARAAAPDLAKPGPKGEERPDHGPAPEAPAKADPGSQGPHTDEQADPLPHGLTPFEAMSIQGVINGVFIVLVPLLAMLMAGARLRDFGLSLREWRRQVAVGVVAVLFLLPIVYSVQWACLQVLDMAEPEIEKHKHPLEKMLRESLSPGLASVAFLTAVVLAPVFEELLFRGFIQPWLVKTFDQLTALRRSPDDRVLESPSLAGVPGPGPFADPDLDRAAADPAAGREYWEADDRPGESPDPDGPILEGPGDDEAPFRPRSPLGTGAAIVLTSLVFAGLHAPQWPAPIPLFLLAMGLGFVAQRTGSLIAPICMHAIFNGLPTLTLLFVALERPDKARPPARPVLERVVPVEGGPAVAPDVTPGPPSAKR